MVNDDSTTATKRRRKRQTLTYKASRNKKKVQPNLSSSKVASSSTLVTEKADLSASNAPIASTSTSTRPGTGDSDPGVSKDDSGATRTRPRRTQQSEQTQLQSQSQQTSHRTSKNKESQVTSTTAEESLSGATTSLTTELPQADKSTTIPKSGSSSGTAKRRRKSQALCYKPPVRKRTKPKGDPPADRDTLSESGADTSSGRRAKTRSFSDSGELNSDAGRPSNSLSKANLDEKGKKKSTPKKSVRKPSASQSDTLRSLNKTDMRSSIPEHSKKRNKQPSSSNMHPQQSISSPEKAKSSTSAKTRKGPKKQKAEQEEPSRKKGKRVHKDDGIREEQIDETSSSPPKKARMSPLKRSRKRTGSKTPTQAKEGSIPDRIKDVSITKKAFSKWKPLTNLTKEFVGEILKSTSLNVMGTHNGNDYDEAALVLETLKKRILEGLSSWKAPPTQGDYRKMESQNEKSEELFVEKTREINTLNSKIEEEQRLLEEDTAKVEELSKNIETCKNVLNSLENEKAHPLIKQTKNVLDLPEFTEELFNTKHVTVEQSSQEENLQQTLLEIQRNVTSCGLTDWMTKLKDLVQNLESYSNTK